MDYQTSDYIRKYVARTGQCVARPVLAQCSPQCSPSARHIFTKEVHFVV